MALIINKHTILFLGLSFFHIIVSDFVDPVLRQTAMAHVYEQACCQEGLAGTTHIKTANGYVFLQDLSVGNILSVPNSVDLQKIILIEKCLIPYFYQIKTKRAVIQCAPAQKIYDAYHDVWVQAKDVTDQNYVGPEKILSVDRINRYVQMYKIHTSQHTFELEHGVVVHNFDMTSVCDVGITIGQLVLKHPVLNAIGKTVSLVKLAVFIYKDFQAKQQDRLEMLMCEDVVIETRMYYETRRQQLLELLQQYQAMHSVMSVMVRKSSNGISLFSQSTFIVPSSLLPALQTELHYLPVEKQKILRLREQELAVLEKKIVAIQLSLAIHLDSMITSKDALFSYYVDLEEQLGQAADKWYQAEYEDELPQMLWQLGQVAAGCDIVSNYIEQRFKELLCLLEVYGHEPKLIILQQSSNIVSVCAWQHQNVVELLSYCAEQRDFIKSCLLTHPAMSQDYPFVRNWNFKAYTEHIQAQLNEQERQRNDNIKIKQSQIQFPTPPNDPDDDKSGQKFDKETYRHDLNEFSENQNDITHMFRKEEHKLIDSPINRQRLLEMVRDKRNCYGQDCYGIVGYAKVEADGSQLWAEVYNYKIRNSGFNKVGQHRGWSFERGFKQRPKNLRLLK